MFVTHLNVFTFTFYLFETRLNVFTFYFCNFYDVFTFYLCLTRFNVLTFYLFVICLNVFTFRAVVTSCNDGLRFQVVDAKKVALQNFLAPSNKKVTLTNGLQQYDDDHNGDA